MPGITAFLENARGFLRDNYELCGLLFFVLALALAGKRKAALAVALSAGTAYGIYSLLSGR